LESGSGCALAREHQWRERGEHSCSSNFELRIFFLFCQARMYRFELSQFSGFHEHCSCAQVPTLSSTGWQGAWHELKTALQRFGDPDSAIAYEGALRVYGITPCAGPETGGTKVHNSVHDRIGKQDRLHRESVRNIFCFLRVGS